MNAPCPERRKQLHYFKFKGKFARVCANLECPRFALIQNKIGDDWQDSENAEEFYKARLSLERGKG